MGWTGDTQGTERTDLPAVEAEATERGLLSLGQERSDTTQTRRHLQRLHFEVGAGIGPTAEHSICQVSSHAEHASAPSLFTLVSHSRDTYMVSTG